MVGTIENVATSNGELTEARKGDKSSKLATVAKGKRGELKARKGADSDFRAVQDAALGAIRLAAVKVDSSGMEQLLALSMKCADYASDELAHGSKWRRAAKDIKTEAPGVVDQLDSALAESGVGTYFGASRLLSLYGLYTLMGADESAEKQLLGCKGHSCWKPLLTLIARNPKATRDENGREVDALEYQWKVNPVTKKPLDDMGAELVESVGSGKMTYKAVADKVAKVMSRDGSGGSGASKPNVDKLLGALSDYWKNGAGKPEEKSAILIDVYKRVKALIVAIRDEQGTPRKPR